MKFAVPVLNEDTAKILQTFGTTETSQTTTKCCQVLDQFSTAEFGKAAKQNQAISETIH